MRTFDERTERNLKTLLPAAQDKARDFMEALEAAGIHAKIISGTRTSAEQNALYAQGRTTPGKIVTNARAGFSNHNFGVAWDIGIFTEDGKYLDESPLYKKAGAIGKKLGLEWGGDWKGIVDEPHFQVPTGLTLAQMRQRVADGIPILPEPAKPQGWSVVGPDGAEILEGMPVIEGKVYAPVRAIAEALGASVTADSAARVVRLVRGD
jgi:peptidoglycan L-alanyl-D-glutamate endopeptidase CwlK